ncbi:hypothetical protein LOZ80_21655 [Paenibacillus sp. HWE-109]|uniref:hypothetical protein n=1 Tax=Paenibacillus sp. HWE-109 TaxID=1306526 RepID=UPI001EDF66E3|nr:hypothetical protein [Paenibacillus sp. HWE-109]UKS24229.1 hypothetical protein LOZ80_21655 [Paenibacillus sp. HWE-109]
MSFQEKKNIVYLISNVLISMLYGIYVFQRYQEAAVDSTVTFKFWGVMILTLIPIAIVSRIIIHIVFSIIHTIATKEKEPSFSDELDKLIELKAIRNSHYVFAIGFALSMVPLAMDMSPSVMFVMLLLSGFVSEVVGTGTQLYLYRKGV